MEKRQIRLLGIDDGPFDKSDRKQDVIVIGTVFRGGDFMDGMMSTKIRKDGMNSTKKMIEMIQKSRFRSQLRAILLDGIALGGFNVIDMERLNRKTGIPVIAVMRKHPDLDKIRTTLKNLGMQAKIPLLEKGGKICRSGNVFMQFCGMTEERARDIVKLSATHSFLPEPIRIAHLIAAGITIGESHGNA